jgi:glucose/mannose transport system substrate-binding protein
MRLNGLASVLAAVGIFSTATSYAKELEVLHWWTSPSEAKSLNKLKVDLQKAGHAWKDGSIEGGSGVNADIALKSRALGGNPPALVQMKGPKILNWARMNFVEDISAVATKDKWDDLIPEGIKKFHKFNGKYVAVPFNVHRVNWIWTNKGVFEKYGLKVPATIDELVSAAEKLKKAGVKPFAHGGQPWQDATFFEMVALGVGGGDFYRKAFVELDKKTIAGPVMLKTFETVRKLTPYLAADRMGMDWDKASKDVITGKAAMQLMGDWAKGEFLGAGKKVDVDFQCVAFPGTQNLNLFVTDSLVFFKVKKQNVKDAQEKAASLILGKEFQTTFNLSKGSIPARSDIALDGFDKCAQESSVAAGKALIPSMTHGMTNADAAAAIIDVMSKYFNSDMKPAEGQQKLVKAVAELDI